MGSTAHERFTQIHGRGLRMVEVSIDLWKLKNQTTKSPTDKEYNEDRVLPDMGRAGIVIAVSAMDDYFTRRFAECVVPLLKSRKFSKKLTNFLGDCGLDVSAALELLTMERPYRRIRKLVDDHLSRHTTQRFKAIDSLYEKTGLSGFSAGIEKRTKRRQLKVSVEKLVERRHDIVHKGDMNFNGRVSDLSYKQAIKRIEDAKLFVDTAEEIIAARMK